MALASLGADDIHVRTFAAEYSKRLEPRALPGMEHHCPVLRENDWISLLGQRKHFLSLRNYFYTSIEVRNSIHNVLSTFLPKLLDGMAGSAFHGLIQLGFALHAYRRAPMNTPHSPLQPTFGKFPRQLEGSLEGSLTMQVSGEKEESIPRYIVAPVAAGAKADTAASTNPDASSRVTLTQLEPSFDQLYPPRHSYPILEEAVADGLAYLAFGFLDIQQVSAPPSDEDVMALLQSVLDDEHMAHLGSGRSALDVVTEKDNNTNNFEDHAVDSRVLEDGAKETDNGRDGNNISHDFEDQTSESREIVASQTSSGLIIADSSSAITSLTVSLDTTTTTTTIPASKAAATQFNSNSKAAPAAESTLDATEASVDPASSLPAVNRALDLSIIIRLLQRLQKDKRLGDILRSFGDDEAYTSLAFYPGFQHHMRVLSDHAQLLVDQYASAIFCALTPTSNRAIVEMLASCVWLYVASQHNHFFVLHLVTSAWSLLVCLPFLSTEEEKMHAIQIYVKCAVLAFGSVHQPTLMPAFALEPPVTWERIIQRTLEKDPNEDEHIAKAVFVCCQLAKMQPDMDALCRLGALRVLNESFVF